MGSLAPPPWFFLRRVNYSLYENKYHRRHIQWNRRSNRPRVRYLHRTGPQILCRASTWSLRVLRRNLRRALGPFFRSSFYLLRTWCLPRSRRSHLRSSLFRRDSDGQDYREGTIGWNNLRPARPFYRNYRYPRPRQLPRYRPQSGGHQRYRGCPIARCVYAGHLRG